MKNFLLNSISFTLLFIFIIVSVFHIRGGSIQVYIKNRNSVFNKKIEYFDDFIIKNDSVNLILGSSIIEDLIIPDSLGEKWFSFTTGGQNIYNSYKFLNYYKDLIKIDTVIIGINIFDFPYSYVNDRKHNVPHTNGNFQIFGKDSISTLGLEIMIKQEIQYLKDKYFFRLKDSRFIKMNKIKYDVKNKYDVWTEQGFSGHINDKPRDLDSLFAHTPDFMNKQLHDSFVNVKSPPNLKYFDLLNNFLDSLNIKVKYLLTPKHESHFIGMKINNYDIIWDDILSIIKNKPIEIWDYETMNTDTFDFHWYNDEIHSTYNGARAFTKIIKERLKE